MQKVISFIKRRKISVMIAAVLAVLILYFFIPRRLYGLCTGSSVGGIDSVSVCCMPNGAEKEYKEYDFTEREDIEAFEKLLDSSYARPKIFNVEYVNGGYEGYYLFFGESSAENDKTVFLFTEKILTVDGRQFVLYGDGFASRLKEILHG